MNEEKPSHFDHIKKKKRKKKRREHRVIQWKPPCLMRFELQK